MEELLSTPFYDDRFQPRSTVSQLFRKNQMRRYSERIETCGGFTGFMVVLNEDEEEVIIPKINYCRVRLCPLCQQRRSYRWQMRSLEALPSIIKQYPNKRWIIATFPTIDCEVRHLRINLERVSKSFKRLTQLKAFPSKKWIKSVEISLTDTVNIVQPIVHALMMVDSCYLSGKKYLSIERWDNLWAQSLRGTPQKSVSMTILEKNEVSPFVLSQLIGSQANGDGVICTPDLFGEYAEQIHNMRFISVGGCLRKSFAEHDRKRPKVSTSFNPKAAIAVLANGTTIPLPKSTQNETHRKT